MKRRKREKKRQAAQCRRLSATVMRSLCVSSDSTAIVGACLVAYAMRVLSTKLKSILYLGGLHCPCDYDSFTASL